MPPANRFPSPWRVGLLALAAWLAACGVIGPSQEAVEKFSTEVVPVIAEWRPEALEPYGTEAFNDKLGTADQRQTFVVFSTLGELYSFEPPARTGYFTSTGKGTFVTVDINARFANGPAMIRMVLRSGDGGLKLNALDIRSPTFGDPSAKPNAVHQI